MWNLSKLKKRIKNKIDKKNIINKEGNKESKRKNSYELISSGGGLLGDQSHINRFNSSRYIKRHINLHSVAGRRGQKRRIGIGNQKQES